MMVILYCIDVSGGQGKVFGQHTAVGMSDQHLLTCFVRLIALQ